MKRIFLSVMVVAGALCLAGIEGTTGNLSWSFQENPYSENYDSEGIPRVISQKVTFPADLYKRLSAALPEGRDVRKTNPNYLSADSAHDIRLQKDTDVWMCFLHEGNAKKNSLGYYTYTQDAPPTDKWGIPETIVFPNSSFNNSGGDANGLHSGDAINLGHFAAGTHIGFVLVADGWDQNNGVKTDQSEDRIYYSEKNLNSEAADDLKSHSLIFYDGANQCALVGVEDALRTDPGCDHDFNDVMIAIKTGTPDSMDVSAARGLPVVSDKDGDAVLDSNDDFPSDATRAFIVTCPSKNSWGTIAFEDLWPKQGDYDMNDLVMRYQIAQTEDSSGRVKDLQMTMQIQARGASMPSGFGVELTNVSPSNLDSASLAINGGTAVSVVPEANQRHMTWILFNRGSDYAPPQAGHSFFNTESAAPKQAFPTFTLKITFKSPPLRATLGAAPYNPFLFRTANRGFEVHLPDYPPTKLADTALFGTGDDKSKPSTGRYYKTAKNLPWAIHIAEDWRQPLEKVSISSAYPQFGPWAESGGTKQLSWYLFPGIDPVQVYP